MNLTTMTTLDAATRDAVLALAASAESADGQSPLNEEARLLLGHPGASHVLAADPGGVLVGYAQWQPDAATGQLVVHPQRRRRGIGSALLSALDQPTVWAFGDPAPARGFAAASGLRAVRELLVMARPLPADLGGEVPDGVRVSGYSDDAEEAFLAVNAAAFAGHPEQGGFDADDLAARQSEGWWDPDGLLLAWDDEGLAGFHWTKEHGGGRGEVYVIGVHPRMAGRRLGAGLLQAGLDRLAARGCDEVILYVDGGNTKARDLYARSGFDVVLRDVLYGRPTAGAHA